MSSNRNQPWTREDLIIAFNLYCKIPFGQINHRNPRVIELAKILDRSPSSVAWKLSNFARLDPALRARGIRGASHGSKGETEVWEEFNGDWGVLAFESERLLAERTGHSLEEFAGIDEAEMPREGKEREKLVRVRVNQHFFRSAVLAAYEYRCCVTGIAVPALLSASHISPWSSDPRNRMNPRNGLCLNSLHHRAFDFGLITITPRFRLRVSSSILKNKKDVAIQTFFAQYDDALIRLPTRFAPDPKLLKRHNELFVD